MLKRTHKNSTVYVILFNKSYFVVSNAATWDIDHISIAVRGAKNLMKLKLKERVFIPPQKI